MATTTTNFGWDIPQSTDLVKDGATAIAALGQDIDTALVDLKGGTTGQVLAKNSNTDLDFTWTNGGDITAVTAGTGISGGGSSGDVTITNSMATAIDAKGDLIVGTGADTFSRLAVGTNDYVLTAASGESTGMKWAALSAGSWSQAATGSLSSNTVTISGLSGKRYYVLLVGWSHTASSEYVQVRLNGDTGTNYRRADSDSAVAEMYLWGSGTVSGASTRSAGIMIDMADTSMVYKPMLSLTPLSTNGSVSGWYNSSSAITSITLFTSGGNFDAGTYYVWSFA